MNGEAELGTAPGHLSLAHFIQLVQALGPRPCWWHHRPSLSCVAPQLSASIELTGAILKECLHCKKTQREQCIQRHREWALERERHRGRDGNRVRGLLLLRINRDLIKLVLSQKAENLFRSTRLSLNSLVESTQRNSIQKEICGTWRALGCICGLTNYIIVYTFEFQKLMRTHWRDGSGLNDLLTICQCQKEHRQTDGLNKNCSNCLVQFQVIGGKESNLWIKSFGLFNFRLECIAECMNVC